MSRKSIVISCIVLICIGLPIGAVGLLRIWTGHKWSEEIPFDDKVWRIADDDLFDRVEEPKKAAESSRLFMAGVREKMVFSLSRKCAGKSVAEVRALLGPENQTKRLKSSELTYPLGPNGIDTRFITIEFADGIYHDYHLWSD